MRLPWLASLRADKQVAGDLVNPSFRKMRYPPSDQASLPVNSPVIKVKWRRGRLDKRRGPSGSIANLRVCRIFKWHSGTHSKLPASCRPSVQLWNLSTLLAGCFLENVSTGKISFRGLLERNVQTRHAVQKRMQAKRILQGGFLQMKPRDERDSASVARSFGAAAIYVTVAARILV